uniref:hypothetical protein n=1 Tax=Halomonas sp. TaxID=1486246 RepID=UPI002607A0CA|nr:hypothetical protein [Halomonas sp.]
MKVRFRYSCLVASAGLVLTTCSAVAAPTLSGELISDLKGLESRLSSDPSGVESKASQQAERLRGGNESDRWAGALYLQLAAGAEAAQEKYAEAADHLAQARNVSGVDAAQRDRWLREEAELRLQAGQKDLAGELLADWLQRHEDGDSLWLMAKLAADVEDWERAADWVERAQQAGGDMSAKRLAFASAVMQRSGRLDQALAVLQTQLDQVGDDPETWRRAAALAQKAGNPVRAAALWEAAWRRGLLSGDDDLERRINLHLAAGTPARAAEILEQALAEGTLPDDDAHQRQLAEAWHQARDRDKALAAWQKLATSSDKADDWLHLGQLALAWGRESLAEEALTKAEQGGAAEAEKWLAVLGKAPDMKEAQSPSSSQSSSQPQ